MHIFAIQKPYNSTNYEIEKHSSKEKSHKII